ALQRGDWAGAAALPVVNTGRAQADSLVRFTRGLGMARSGDLAGAKREIQAMQELRAALEKSNQSYWGDRTEEQMLAVSAWVAQAEGNREQALKEMRAAADGEDGSVKHVAMENRLYPMRELLAELLLQSGQPAAALREFESASKENPNRYRGLYGAARAAEAAGDRANADVAAVGVDAQDRVYAFNRGAHPMVVFDRDGNFLRSWGEGVFRRAHGVHVAPDDTLWLTDDGDHTVRHCTLEGKILLTLGVPGKPTAYMSGEPFHRCTHTALS